MRLCTATIIITTVLALAQSQPSRSSATPAASAELRLATIAKEYASCDTFSAEGLRFECLDNTINAYEAEIEHLNAEVEANLCPEQIKSFKETAKSWSTYYQMERSHLHQLNECEGSIELYGSKESFVQLLAARCSYLCSQLSDYR